LSGGGMVSVSGGTAQITSQKADRTEILEQCRRFGFSYIQPLCDRFGLPYCLRQPYGGNSEYAARMSLFVSKGVDRIQRRGLVRRVISKEDPDGRCEGE
jgi:hypothetical protein